jgi:Mlc titration factor MtfA (ptsG expression regulator)
VADARILDWHEVGAEPFPAHWRPILAERVPFYGDLGAEERARFEEKVAEAIGEAGRWKVTVSWTDLVRGLAAPHDGENVGYHEFAHALDDADGSMDGEPTGPASEVFAGWEEVIAAGRAEVQRALDANVDPPIDAYAAKNDAEFFAVATEWFFECPRALRQRLPDVHELLRRFYRQDPPLEDVDEPPASPARATTAPVEAASRLPEPTAIPAAISAASSAGPSPSTAERPFLSTPLVRVEGPRGSVGRPPVHIPEVREWGTGAVLRLVGSACITLALLMRFPCAGSGSGRSHQPGAELLQELSITPHMVRFALILGAVGVVALVASLLFPHRSAPDGQPRA